MTIIDRVNGLCFLRWQKCNFDSAKRRMSLLRLEGVSVRYGKSQALSDVSLSVGKAGEIVTLIGANGGRKKHADACHHASRAASCRHD